MASVTVKTQGTQQNGKVYVGRTHTAIQAAVNYVAANGGGTVFVEAGTYTCTAPVSLPSNLELAGEGDATVLRSGSAGSLTSSNKTNVFVHDLLVDGSASASTASYGMTFTGAGTGADNRKEGNELSLLGSSVLSDYGFRVEDCTILGHAGYGIYAENCFHSQIVRNIFEEGLEYAIYTNGFRACVIEENFVMGGTKGIYGSSIEELKISGNVLQQLSRTSENAIMLVAPDRVSISGNQIRNCRGTGVRLLNATHTLVSSNVIDNNAGNGISLSGPSAANTISGNVLTSNQGHQLLLTDTDNRGTTVSANVIVHGSAYGLYANGTPNNTYVGNVCGWNGDTDLMSRYANRAWIGGNICEVLSATGTGNYSEYNVDF